MEVAVHLQVLLEKYPARKFANLKKTT